MHATVAPLCSISAGSSLTFTAALTDASVASNTGTTNEVTDSAAYCNQAATTIAVSHTHLTTSGAAGPGFTNDVNYTPVVTVNSTAINDTASTLVGTFSGIKVKATSPSAAVRSAMNFDLLGAGEDRKWRVGRGGIAGVEQVQSDHMGMTFLRMAKRTRSV